MIRVAAARACRSPTVSMARLQRPAAASTAGRAPRSAPGARAGEPHRDAGGREHGQQAHQRERQPAAGVVVAEAGRGPTSSRGWSASARPHPWAGCARRCLPSGGGRHRGDGGLAASAQSGASRRRDAIGELALLRLPQPGRHRARAEHHGRDRQHGDERDRPAAEQAGNWRRRRHHGRAETLPSTCAVRKARRQWSSCPGKSRRAPASSVGSTARSRCERYRSLRRPLDGALVPRPAAGAARAACRGRARRARRDVRRPRDGDRPLPGARDRVRSDARALGRRGAPRRRAGAGTGGLQ